ncbi:MAG: lipid-A-disaccharide synthase [Candidatus Eisenbacteria sp.]|nr:lipid-A-disaccharide synthase [Candidatus Eisenbacteria bacterium]
MTGPRILIVAGEPSGENHAARLARALRAEDPHCRLFGVGGSAMREAGVHLLAEVDLGVIGFAEVVRHLPALRRLQQQLGRFFRDEPPDLFIPVDYPGFNLRMCRTARRHEVPVMYYISPQVWAWGRARVKKIARLVDRMVTILPFEEAFYAGSGVDVEFVGHPLLESLDEDEDNSGALRESLGMVADQRLIGLLPGSRESEISRMFPVMLSAADRIRRAFPELRFVAAAWSDVRARQLARLSGSSSSWLDIVTGDARTVIRASEMVLVASGTATLETACLETPMVVLYRLSLLSWLIGRAVVRVPHIALANLVAGEQVVPELVQHDATPERIANEALRILESPERQREMREALKRVRGRLGYRDASRRAAAIALSLARSGAGRTG